MRLLLVGPGAADLRERVFLPLRLIVALPIQVVVSENELGSPRNIARRPIGP